MKTHRKLTPVEMAIDRACGMPAGSGEVQIFLTIRCPKCGRVGRTPAIDSDPEGTREIVAECPKCAPAE